MIKTNVDKLLKQLGEEIKKARSIHGLSQEALALSAQVDRTYVSQLERGVANPSVQILKRIAVALDAELKVSISPSPTDRQMDLLGSAKP